MGTGSKQKGSPKSGAALAATSQEIMGETRDARNSYFSQLQDAINTGGAGGRIPILNAALGGANYAKDQSIQDTVDRVNRAGLGGTDFGNAAKLNTTIEGGRTVGATRDAIIRQLLGQAPNAALTFAQQGEAGLAQSAQTNAQKTAAANASQAQLIGGGAAAAGAIAGGVIIAV